MRTPLVFLGLGLGAMTGTVLADTFFLKDGTQLIGKVTSRDSTHYVIEVQVTKSIKDERKVARADVLRIEEEKADLKAFEEIAKLMPIPDMLTAADYAARIKLVEKFLADHRGTPKSNEAKALLADLKSEANEILAGGIKMNGKIIPPTEYRANAYEIDARVKAAAIRSMAKAGLTLQALRAFAEFDREFQNTEPRRELIPFITQTIQSYLAEVGEMANTLDARTKERTAGLESMSGSDRQGTQRAIQEETAALEARFKSEKAASVAWVTVSPFCKPALDDTLSFGKQEISRINTDQNQAPDAGKIFRDTLALIGGTGQSSAITSAISAAESSKMPQRYLDILKNAATARGVKP